MKRVIHILSILVSILVFSIIVISIIAILEIYWITNYTPEEQYSTDIHRCSPEDLNISISMWHMRSTQPNNSVVISTNRGIFGNRNFENLTQEQWLKNAEIIFYWISWNIDYNDSEHLFPRLPDETIDAKSGDCDDLAFLYISMAINAGVPADNIRLVMVRERFEEPPFTCKPTHMYVELKYVYDGKKIWMPIELTNKASRFNQFLTNLYLPGVRFYWLGYENFGYFDDRNIEQDTTYETKIRLFNAYANDSLSIDNLEEVLVHAFDRYCSRI